MSEFESLAEELVEEARNEEAKQQQRDLTLIGKVLEIYDQKFVAELLRKLGNSDWTRETLNRWINGKCGPRSLT
ncbi:DNA (cytosine-5-)-methyltransferase, partial [Klebsiella pneumoniae]|nr:DNA (cytosine-5-)-methyltransferase [Klebsiella pneumoniae]